MGFQDMRPVVHQAASRKGGSVRKKKGLAVLSQERVKEIASMGGRTSAEHKRNQIGKIKADSGGDLPVLADILEDLDETHKG